jgi:hypothetical protein
MKQSKLMEKYPLYELALGKEETSCKTVDDIVAALEARIDANPRVALIGIFDHYAHTKSIDGSIDEGILAAKNIIFCFGFALPNPRVLSVRPRSIGIADMGSHFHISFMEPPMEIATIEMEKWCTELADKRT